jgi:gamma-glutamylcyclotransferase (GGCT)/AIG2-like uncharacterized protein YtfP
MKIFAYGTLLPGMPLISVLAGARRVGPAIVPGNLLDLGPYAGLVAGEGEVTGELFDVDDRLRDSLDKVEGFRPEDPKGSLYVRRRVAARRFSDGGPVDAEAYFFNQVTNAEKAIPCGDFRRFATERGGGPVWVIAYGSNISTARLDDRLKGFGPERAAHRRETVRVGWLEGFRLTFNKRPEDGGPPYANIEFEGGEERCPAIAWELTPEEVARLDKKEGATGGPNAHYYRVGLPLETMEGPLLAQVYLAGPSWLQRPAAPRPVYLGHLTTGYEEVGRDKRALKEAEARALRSPAIGPQP